MQRYEGNLIDALEKGWPWVGYVQFADSPGRNEPGTGEVNYREVFAAVKRLGYAAPLGAECLPLGGDVKRAAGRLLG
jgi:hydroxypyruvate isomerase